MLAKQDFFAHKAGDYEKSHRRLANVDNIAQAIIHHVQLDQSMRLIDFGAGTGLLLERIAPYVQKITAMDISESMITVLANKRDRIDCDLEILNINLVTEAVEGLPTVDGIISSMTMHHIKDIEKIFHKLFSLFHDGGFLAIADLDAEDGSFHSEDTGVHHFGFDRTAFAEMARAAGFSEVTMRDASTIQKPQGEYGVFLLTAKR